MKRLALVLCLLLSAPAAFSQTGFPLYGSFQSGQSDSINLQNLNTNFSIPLVSTPGRNGSFGISLVYNSMMWSPTVYGWLPGVPGATPNGGWTTTNPIGSVTYNDTVTDGTCGRCYAGGDCDGYKEIETLNGYVYVDPAGTPHTFSSVYAKSTYVSCTNSTTYTQNLTGYSNDGLYYINLTSNPPSTILIWSSTGAKLDFTSNPSIKATDRNGNIIQKSVSGGIVTWTDSAGHTSLRIINSGSNVEYHYYDTSGTDQNFTLKYQNYSVMTNFGCSTGDYNSSGTLPQISLPYELDLPNGRTYSISYEGTPSHSGYVTGRVSQITLPTGGSYQYQYTGSNDGINCSDGTLTNLTRIVSDGSTSNTWSYARTSISGAAGTTTVTAPTLPYDSAGNQSVYTFNSSGQQTQELDYQGSSTLLRTVNSTWASNGSPATQVTILPTSQQSEVDTTYDGYGHLTQMKEYDWGSGATGSLLRETDISFSTISATFAFLVPSQKLVKDGGGTVKYREDYAYDGSTPTCVTGAVQHDDSNYGCSFNTRGNMTSLTTYTDPATPSGGATKSFTYDVFGNLHTAQLNCCQLKTFSYSSATNYAYPDSVVSGSSSPTLSVSATYNSYTGQVASSTDENSKTTSYSYDSLKRMTTVTRPDSVSLATSYNDTALTVTQSTPIDGSNTLKVISTYDGLGRPIITTTTDSGGSTTYSAVQTIYDPIGRAYKTSNPYTSSPAYWTESRFDGLGRALTTILPDTTQSTASYSGNCSTATDAASKSRKSCSDGLGRMTKVYEDPSSANYETDYTYNVLDALTQVSQGAQTRTYAYDGMGRLTSSATPEAGTFNFSYNSFNLLTQRTDARGVITTYTYDSLNRPYQVSYSVGSTGIVNPGTVTYTYGTSSSSNNNGRLTQMADGTGSEGYTYDILGRITQVAKPLWCCTYNIGYTYNYAGQLTQITYPSGRTVAQNYDAIGRLCSITSGATGCSPSSYYASSFGYTTAQQVSGFTYGNGVAASFGYSADRLQLTSLAYAKSGSNLFSLSYGYTSGQSNNGQITNISDSVDSGRTAGYSYDALARLSAASTSGSSGFAAWGLSFTYDRYGNRTAQTVTAGSAPSNSLSVDSTTNHLTNTGFSYDANGNMTNDGTNSLVYDAENHLLTSTGSGGTGGYLYDGNGLRVEKCVGNCSTATTYAKIIYSGGKPIAEDSTATGLTEYIYSGGALLATIDSSGTRYHHRDHLSPRVTTDSSGTVIGQQGHYPFGESWYAASTTTKYQFTTYERDSESGNDYAEARYHINRLGRFNSPDPLGGHIDDPQSFNRYSYVRNEPIDFEDPSGLKTGCAVAFTPHLDGSLGINVSGPWTDNGDEDALTELVEPPESCGNPNCTVILDGATAPCVFAFGGGGGGGTGTANDSVMFINCTVDNPFYTGGCVGLQLDPDGNGKWIAWVPKGRLVTATVDGTSAGTTAFMDGNYWAWQTGPIPQGTAMNSCSDAESCALSIFFPQVSAPIPPSNAGGGGGLSPQEGLEAIHNGGNIAAPINNPAFPAIWFGSQLGGFGLTYAAPFVPPALATLHTVALGCALSDRCRDNVMDGVVGLIPDAEDGRMPTTPVGLVSFLYSTYRRVHQ